MKLITSAFLVIMASLFISCGENTTTTIIKDVESIQIDSGDMQIYSTDEPINVYASVTYTDGSTVDATLNLKWSNSEYQVLNYDAGTIWGGISNGGEVTLGVTHYNFEDSVAIKVNELKSFYITTDDINATGDYILQAYGSFDDNSSEDRLIVKNITWSADNDAEITYEDDVYTITMQEGDTNVTATVFYDINTSSPTAPVSKVYSIN